jgi:tyrosinase
MLQADSQNNLLSFYQIAGIHGRPYKAWDNAHGSRDNTYTGYCTHDSILFLTWHRPYLALLEQIISKNAVTISKQYKTNQASWLTAGKTLRIPYWDWAADSNIPNIVQSQTVTITTPSGKKTITNPLYSYKFHPLSSTDFPASSGPLATKPATVRGPNANAYLASLGLKSQTYDILTRANSFLNFGSQLSSGNSLEAIHGNVHVAVAAFSNNYHMADLGYAAFDPIFWLHHTNVDRLWAMWSVLNPNSYLPASTTDQYGTFSINPGSQDTPTTSLIPFWHATNYYNSNSARGTRTFGYSYTEINDWAQSAATQRKNLIASINSLYGPSSGKKRSFDNDDVIDVERQPLEIIERDNVYSGSSSQTTAWFVAVSVKKFALSSGFNVKVFLGEPTGDPETWITAGNLVGVLTNFVPKAVAGAGVGGTSKPIYVGGQELPAEVSDMVTHAEFVLDDNLVRKGLVYADADKVASAIQSELVWKVNLVSLLSHYIPLHTRFFPLPRTTSTL